MRQNKSVWLEDFTPWTSEELPLQFVGYPDKNTDYAIQYAMEFYNSLLNKKILTIDVLSGKRTFGHVEMKLPGSTVAKIEFIRRSDTNKLVSTSLIIDKDKFMKLDQDIKIRVIKHEFGHLLGLKHDNDKKSLMYEKITEDTKPQLLDKHIKALKDAYSKIH